MMTTMLAPEVRHRRRIEGVEYRYPEPCGLSKKQVFALAEEVNAELELEPGFDIDLVAGQLGGHLHVVTPYGIDDADGSIIVYGVGDMDIFLPDDAGPRRNRFTVAHEMGHYFLHYRPEPNTVFLARREGTGRTEWEAHWFARAFLMPEQAFRDAHERCDRRHADIADVFNVSLKACEIRADDLDLELR